MKDMGNVVAQVYLTLRSIVLTPLSSLVRGRNGDKNSMALSFVLRRNVA
jgi:hypothetical protein